MDGIMDHSGWGWLGIRRVPCTIDVTSIPHFSSVSLAWDKECLLDYRLHVRHSLLASLIRWIWNGCRRAGLGYHILLKWLYQHGAVAVPEGGRLVLTDIRPWRWRPWTKTDLSREYRHGWDAGYQRGKEAARTDVTTSYEAGWVAALDFMGRWVDVRTDAERQALRNDLAEQRKRYLASVVSGEEP